MDVAASVSEVGVRELKNRLSLYLAQVKDGDEVVVTERGQPVARIVAIDHPSDRLAQLIASGAVRPPLKSGRRTTPTPIDVSGTVSDLVVEQRR